MAADNSPEAKFPTGSPAVNGSAGRWAILVACLALVTGTFAYLSGRLTPNELTPAKMVDRFESPTGVHDGFRRNHAKGVCVTGFFDSSGQAQSLCKSVMFAPGRVPVIGRFSLGGPDPHAADTPGAARGLGLQFSLPNGEFWRAAMINLPVFPVNSPKAFYDFLLATKPDPATGKPNGATLKQFIMDNPASGPALKIIQSTKLADGFYDATFHSLNAFWLTDASGNATPVRWIFEPDPANSSNVNSASPTASGPATEPAAAGVADRFFNGLVERIAQHPLKWHLMFIVGQPGDSTTDATLLWPGDRKQIDAGVLTIDTVQSDDSSPARDLNFDPLVLPAGMSPSDDPLLSARSAAYSQSFTRRESEHKQPAEITDAAVKQLSAPRSHDAATTMGAP